jgi:hypothetical protein
MVSEVSVHGHLALWLWPEVRVNVMVGSLWSSKTAQVMAAGNQTETEGGRGWVHMI